MSRAGQQPSQQASLDCAKQRIGFGHSLLAFSNELGGAARAARIAASPAAASSRQCSVARCGLRSGKDTVLKFDFSGIARGTGGIAPLGFRADQQVEIPVASRAMIFEYRHHTSPSAPTIARRGKSIKVAPAGRNELKPPPRVRSVFANAGKFQIPSRQRSQGRGAISCNTPLPALRTRTAARGINYTQSERER